MLSFSSSKEVYVYCLSITYGMRFDSRNSTGKRKRKECHYAIFQNSYRKHVFLPFWIIWYLGASREEDLTDLEDVEEDLIIFLFICISPSVNSANLGTPKWLYPSLNSLTSSALSHQNAKKWNLSNSLTITSAVSHNPWHLNVHLFYIS